MDVVAIDNFLNGFVPEKRKKEKKNKAISKEDAPSGFNVVKLPSASTNFPQRPAMKEKIIPDMASSVVLVGGTSSGKTTALINMFLNPNMYRGYFDEIYLFSKTGASDSLFEYLELKDERVIMDKMIPELEKLVKKFQKEADQKGVDKTKKRAIIFEDLSANAKLMKSPAFLKCFVQNRHMGCMVFACVHSYTRLTRTCRLNASNIFIFPCPLSDLKLLCDDHCPPNMSKKQFINGMITYAHKPDSQNAKPFLHINCKVDFPTRYRKCFDVCMRMN